MATLKERRLIAGAGSSGGKGSSRTPIEDKDDVQSRSLASILDLLGEGQIGGLVDGAKSIFLDNVPLLNPDGSSNFNGVSWWFRNGSQDQAVIEGFDAVETPHDVGAQIKRDTPRTIQIDNDDADQVRVIMMFPKLASSDRKTGDIHGTTVEFRFELSSGSNAFAPITPKGHASNVVRLSKKSSGKHFREYIFDLPKPGGNYRIRVSRITEDSNTDYVQNQTWLSQYGEIVNTKLNYPNSALVGLRIDSQQFGSAVPARSYLVSGLKIRVPSNYSSLTNDYVGDWDGSFKLEVSSNPAWILYDVLTSERYGLGQYISDSMINIGQLYQIGRYCDAEVPDMFGGREKRFAINTVINNRGEAYKVLQDIVSVFRGMIFWAGGMVNVMQDCPGKPVMLFSSANIIGKVSYKGSSRKDRATVALITYNDKNDLYKQNIEYVEDEEGIKRFGVRKIESVAFGCTSRGQAHRVGLWTLYSNRMETDLITFTSGLDASLLIPGELVSLQDKFRSGKRNSGRMISFTRNSIKLDAEVNLSKSGNTVSFLSAKGKMVSRDIIEGAGGHSTVTFKKALEEGEMPVAMGLWTIIEPDLEPMQVRVLSVNQNAETGSFDIVGVQHNPSKFAAIDEGVTLIPTNNTTLDPTFSTPENLQVEEGTYLSSPGNLAVKLIVSWEGKSPLYILRYRRSDVVSDWVKVETTDEQCDIFNVAESGTYDIEVYSISVTGRRSGVISAVYKTYGTMTPPDAPKQLTAVGDYRVVSLNWLAPTALDVDKINVYASKTNDIGSGKLIASLASTSYTHTGLDDDETWFYWVRAVNKRGMLSPPNSPIGTEATTKDVLSFLKNKITSSELGKELLADIDQTETKEAVKDINAKIDQSVSDLNQSVGEIETSLTNMEKAQGELKESVDGTLGKVDSALKDVEDAVANVVALENTISKQGEAVAGTIDAVQTALDGSKALVAEEKEARISGDEALSKRVDTVKSVVETGQASIDEMKQTVADVEKSASTWGTSIEANAKANIDTALRQEEDKKQQLATNATINTSQEALADSVSSVSKRVDQMKAEIGDDIAAQLQEERETRASADEAMSKSVTALKSEMDGSIKASLETEQQTRATADSALSKQITNLQSQVDIDIKAQIATEAKTRADKDSALSSQISTLSAKVNDDVTAQIATESKARADADSALSNQVTSLKAQTANDIKAAVATETKARADADSAMAGNISSLQTKTGALESAVTSETTARTDADTALGKRVDSINAKTDSVSATVQQTSNAVADVNNKVSASWSLKMETSAANGQKYAAGMALGIDGTGLSQFLIRADRFGLVNSVDGRITTPFVIENSVTYMNGAYIKDGTISNAKIGDIQSTNYTPGKSGWRISKGGAFEMNGNSGGNGRLVISNNRIDVYDENGVLRVRMGLL